MGQEDTEAPVEDKLVYLEIDGSLRFLRRRIEVK